MALIIRGASECAVCGRVIDTVDDIVTTSPFLGRDHPLWRYSDVAMHRECFLSWKDRATFVAAFNSIVSPQVTGNGTTRHMLDDGSIRVVHPERDPPETEDGG